MQLNLLSYLQQCQFKPIISHTFHTISKISQYIQFQFFISQLQFQLLIQIQKKEEKKELIYTISPMSTYNGYISHHLRNRQSHKKNERHISSIMNEIRFLSQEDQQYDHRPVNQFGNVANSWGNRGGARNLSKKLDQIDLLQASFKGNGGAMMFGKARRKVSRNSFGQGKKFIFRGISGEEDAIREPEMFTSQKKNRVNKSSAFKEDQRQKKQLQKQSQKHLKHRISSTSRTPHNRFLIHPSQKNFTPSLTPRPFFSFSTFKASKKHKKKQPSFLPPSSQPPQIQIPESPHIQTQNIHRLNSFIKGGYDSQFNQFTNVVNLSEIDRFRRNFYVYQKIYEEMVENNIGSKMNLRDCEGQSFRDVVFINQMKDHATAPEFIAALQQLKIIR